MNEPVWYNRQTREAWIEAMQMIDDAPGFAESWLDMCGREDAVELLAAQLFKDQKSWASRWDDPFLISLIVAGLRHVNWKQVARQLLSRAPVKEEATEEGGEAECC